MIYSSRRLYPYPKCLQFYLSGWVINKKTLALDGDVNTSTKGNSKYMTKKPDYRTKMRAVFLAAIMIISVVGMSVAFAGAAAAQDDDLRSGSTYWQGQELQVSNLGSVTSSGDDLQVREYDRSDDVIGSLVEEVSIDGADAVIKTDDLDGNYVITNSSSTSQAIEFDADGNATGNVYPRDGALEDNDPSFEVTEQIIRTLEFKSGVIDNGQDATVELEFDSNRGTTTYNVSADGNLEREDLWKMFNSSVPLDQSATPSMANASDTDNLITGSFGEIGYYADGNDADDVDADEMIVIRTGDREADVFFEDIDAGEYEILFDAVDSTAQATTSINVDEEDVDGSFSQGVYQQTAGDIVEFELELEDTDEVWVQIGDQDSDFVDVVHIKVDDEDETVSFQVNTRTLGSNTTLNNVYDAGDNIEDFTSALHGGDDESKLEGIFFDDDGSPLDDSTQGANDGDIEHYLTALGIIEDDEGKFEQLTRPLQPTDYELYAAVEGDNGAVFIVNDDDETEADDEIDSAVLELQAPSLTGITTWVAPADDANEQDELADLLEVVTERSDVALDDRVVVQYEASGLYGSMVAGSNDNFDILEDGTSAGLIDAYDNTLTNEGINFVFETDDAIGNQDATRLDFSRVNDEEEAFVIIDNEGGQFFLIVDTDADIFANGEPEDGATWDIELEYETNDDDRPEFADATSGFEMDSSADGFPYFAADSTEEITAEITFEEIEISFDNLNEDDEVQAENVENSVISGTTNVAPGSNAELRLASTDASTSFRLGQGVEIESNGTVSGEFDLSDQEAGDKFDTRFRVSGSNVDTVDSVIVEEGDLGVEDSVEDDEDDVVDDDDDVVDDDDDVVDDEDDTVDDETDDETPGFGALVALIALIGAALLAVRRQY